ncbi:PH domain-containing protein [Pseudonocardia phyllosphaerae]|uniref:PH domain-containing protein n=1 Tax=Pseudonocardia phyllosphaerae TaxID=3390502 RepID=UPI00397B43B0
MAFPDALLDERERVALYTGPHWRVCLRPAATLPLIAVPAGFAASVVRLQTWAPWAWALIAILAALAAARWVVAPIARWRCTRLVVTSSRLLARDGVVAVRSVQVPLDRIDAVRVATRRGSRAGTLHVDAADGRYTFTDVPRVEHAQARLHREIGHCADRARSAHLERVHATRRAHADRVVRTRAATRTGAGGVRLSGWGAARAAPERTSS